MLSNPPSASTGRNDLRTLLAEGPFEEGAYVRVYCPYHGDATKPGGAVYEAHFYCFTCSRWAGRKEFLSLLSQTNDIVAVSVVQGGSSSNGPLSPALAEGYARILWGPRKERLSWLLERGLDERTIREAGIGHTGRAFSIPIYSCEGSVQGEGFSSDAGSHRLVDDESPLQRVLVSIKYRLDPYYDTCTDECTCPKYTNSNGSQASLYVPGGILGGMGGRGGNCYCLCEGEFDALLLARYGIPSCSLTSGAGSGYEALECLRGRPTVIVYDTDRPGQLGALRARDFIGSSARIATWNVERDEKGKVLPGWPKDVTDFVKMHGIDKFRRLARV